MNRKAGPVIEWTGRVLIAAAFLVAGGAKFGASPIWIRLFEEIGFGQWFRYFTGVVEVGGALLLLVPQATLAAAVLLGGTMIGIVITHVSLHHLGRPTVVISVLFIMLMWIGRRRWKRSGSSAAATG